MRIRELVKQAIGFGLLAGLLISGPVAVAQPVEGSYWYAIDNIIKIEDGARVVVWATLPPDWHGQEINLISIDPEPVKICVDELSGNKVVEWLWEPEAWEMLPKMEPRHFFFHYEFTLEEKSDRFDFDAAKVGNIDSDSDLFKTFTAAATWIQTDGQIRDMARKIIGQETNPGLQAKLLYDWALENLEFVPGGEGRRDALNTLKAKRGDCGQFSTLYTALCRSLGVPARNLSLAWLDGGLHDFSEIHLPGYGWFPVDISLGQMLTTYRGGMSQKEVAKFMKIRNIPLGDSDFTFGNLPDSRLIISQGVNVRFDSPTLGKQVNLQRMRPGGTAAFPQGFVIEGFNSSLVHGGFHVFDEKVANEDRAHALAHQHLANAFFKEGLYDVVEEGCRSGLNEFSDGVQTWINLGKVYMHKGEYYKAEAAFKRAQQGVAAKRNEKAEALTWVHNYLGNCYDLLGRREMAEAEYRMIVEKGDNFRGAVDYAKKYLERPFKKEAWGN